MNVASEGRRADAEDIASRIRFNPELAQKLYDTIAPGTTVIVTEQPVVRNRRSSAILENQPTLRTACVIGAALAERMLIVHQTANRMQRALRAWRRAISVAFANAAPPVSSSPRQHSVPTY